MSSFEQKGKTVSQWRQLSIVKALHYGSVTHLSLDHYGFHTREAITEPSSSLQGWRQELCATPLQSCQQPPSFMGLHSALRGSFGNEKGKQEPAKGSSSASPKRNEMHSFPGPHSQPWQTQPRSCDNQCTEPLHVPEAMPRPVLSAHTRSLPFPQHIPDQTLSSLSPK